jgi:hypothetical protein
MEDFMNKQILAIITVSTIIITISYLAFTVSTQTVLTPNASEQNLLADHMGNSPLNGGSTEHAHGVGGGRDKG